MALPKLDDVVEDIIWVDRLFGTFTAVVATAEGEHKEVQFAADILDARTDGILLECRNGVYHGTLWVSLDGWWGKFFD